MTVIQQESPARVMFRVWNDTGTVIAIFPDIESSVNNPNERMMYESVGGHGGGDVASVIQRTRPATLREFARTYDELRFHYGYNLTVMNPPSARTLELLKNSNAESRRAASFAYYGDLELGVTWCASGTVGRSRDSRLLEESNFEVVSKDLESRFPDDIVTERHSHWLVGWVESIFVRAIDDYGYQTPAIEACHEWHEKLDNYPAADEDHYSQMESESQWDSIVQAIKSAPLRKRAPKKIGTLASRVHDWLDSHEPRALENVDDDGYIDEFAVLRALRSFGYLMVSELSTYQSRAFDEES